MGTALRHVTIGHADRDWHEAYFAYTPKLFPRIDFRRWQQLGGWSEDYRALCLVSGDEIVANVSLHRMTLVVEGRERVAWQLGAVGVVPAWRGRGLQNELMERVRAAGGRDEVLFLFGHPGVVDFYPRFGFERGFEQVFGAECALAPRASDGVRRLELGSAEDRALLDRLARSAEPVTRRFGARGHAAILLWYWINFHPRHVFHLAQEDALVVAYAEGDTLHVCDVLAKRPFELARHLPALVSAPVRALRFGFTPERYWPDARPVEECREDLLFVQRGLALPCEPFKFPVLAQT